MTEPNEPLTPQNLGEALAAQIGDKEWVLDVEDLPSGEPISDFGFGTSDSEDKAPADTAATGDQPAVQSEIRHPKSETEDVPVAEAVVEDEIPPAPLQIIEAMLFIGGEPLKAERACEIIRGLGVAQFKETIEILNRVYRLQNRPYSISATEQGYALGVRPKYKPLRERLFGGPREARLTQGALDVLALIAYRQPAAKNEIDSIRGADSGSILRQLVRLGLISVAQRAEAGNREVSYGTTPRFLELFNLKALEDLPQIGDPQRL